MRKLVTLFLVAVLALAAAGCGSSGSSDGGKDDPTTTKAEGTTTTAPDGGDEADDEDEPAPPPTKVTEAAYIAAFTKGMSTGDEKNGQLVLPAAAAKCVAPKFVAAATVKLLNRAGVTVEDAENPSFDVAQVGLDEDQAQALLDAYAACDFDIYGALASALTAGLGDDVASCTAENIDHDLADAMLVKTFSSGESDAEFEALLTDLQSTCDLPAN